LAAYAILGQKNRCGQGGNSIYHAVVVL
jgi:hypothetical protein